MDVTRCFEEALRIGVPSLAALNGQQVLVGSRRASSIRFKRRSTRTRERRAPPPAPPSGPLEAARHHGHPRYRLDCGSVISRASKFLLFRDLGSKFLHCTIRAIRAESAGWRQFGPPPSIHGIEGYWSQSEGAIARLIGVVGNENSANRSTF
jgi:hypothetical protein